MRYFIRLMNKDDVQQVNEIDREAFPTQWPPPNYRHELQNQLARYIVACDETFTLPPRGVEPERGLARLVSRIKKYFNRNGASGDAPPSGKKYIVGFAGIWVLADEAHITNIAVRRNYQRRGIGELLLITTIDMARELKASLMTLEVRASNYNAQNLYRKYGFTQVGIRRAYYTDNREDGIVMTTENINSAAYQARLAELRKALGEKLGT